MIFPKTIVGKFVDLKSITLEDAEFSYRIRADKKNCDTVGQVALNLNDQVEFLKWQISEPNDYYFVVFNKKGEKIGLIGVYDIHDDMGEIGREVNMGEPNEIIEVGLLIRDFCVRELGLKKSCCVVYANNIHHIRDIKKTGGCFLKNVIRGGRESLYFEQNLEIENSVVKKIRAIIEKM